MPRPAIYVLITVVLFLCPVASGQLVQMEMVTVRYNPTDPKTQQPDGPEYSFSMGRYEVTIAQYIAFLNDAEVNQGNPRGANLAFRANGDVGLPSEAADSASVFSLVFNNSNGYFNHGLSYNTDQPVGSRYSYDPAFARHPIVGVSWYGALKFCNWLTIDQGLPLEERAYLEGPADADWDSQVGDLPLGDQQRQELVDSYSGFRLPMDENGGTTAGAFNEWYKAAAWDGNALVNHVYGFGRDVLTASDANSLNSGDPWETGTTPIGYYDGVNPNTNPNGNYYGIHDLSGNVMEWMQDWDVGGRRTERGGIFYDVDPILQLRVDWPRNQWPRSTPVGVGFRVVQVLESSTAGDFDFDGDVDLADFTRFQYCFNGPNRAPFWAGCDDTDLDDDTDVDLADFSLFASCFNGPNRPPACE